MHIFALSIKHCLCHKLFPCVFLLICSFALSIKRRFSVTSSTLRYLSTWTQPCNCLAKSCSHPEAWVHCHLSEWNAKYVATSFCKEWKFWRSALHAVAVVFWSWLTNVAVDTVGSWRLYLSTSFKMLLQQHAMLIHIALLCLQDDNCVCCHIWFVWFFPLHILMFQYMYTLNHFVYLSGLGDPQSLFRFSALMSAWSFRSIVVQTSWCNRQWQIWHLLNYNHRERQLHFRLWQNVSLAALNNGHCADLWKSIQLWCCVSDSIHSYIHIHIHSSNHALIPSTHVFL